MYELENIKRLSQIHEDKDIQQMTYAIAHGNHCPLYGVVITTGAMKDFQVLVCGTEECTFYTKYTRISPSGDHRDSCDNVSCFVYAAREITFGASEEIVRAIGKIKKQSNPRAIMLVSSCVPSIIGEDFKAIAAEAEKRWQIPVLPVAIDHFKCASHATGIERTLTALGSLMGKQPIQKGLYNLLGIQRKVMLDCEVVQVLKAAGLKLNKTIPYETDLESLQQACAAELNIVTDPTAMVLAESMQERFQIPYVKFYRYLSPGRIERAYDEIEKYTKKNLKSYTLVYREKALAECECAKRVLNGLTYYFGNYFLPPFDSCMFFCELGMKPLLIEAREYRTEDKEAIQEILKMGYDPYVCRAGNMEAMDSVYEGMPGKMNLGMESSMKMKKYGMVQSAMMGVTGKLGYELSAYAAKEARENWEEK